MSQVNDTHMLNAIAGEALGKYVRVKPSVGSSVTAPITVVAAGAGERGIGVTRAAVASGEKIAITLYNKQGTIFMVSASAFAALSTVYPASSGQAGATVSGVALGTALYAPTGAGQVIEVLPFVQGTVGDLAGAFTLEEDFFSWDSTAGPFVQTADAGATGTTAVQDAVGGVLAVFTDGDDNDEAYMHTITENFLFAANKPIFFEARIAPVEGATNAAAFIIGLMSAAGADALQDTEAGPKASYSGIVFYKVAGGLTWSAEASIGGTQTAIALSGAGVTYTSGTFYRFGIEWIPTSSTAGTANLYIDGVLVGSQSFTFTGATEMDLIAGAKSNGSAEERLSIDYIRCSQVR